MVQIWQKCKPLWLISPINTDHAMFIWKSKPVLSFSKKLSIYQNSKTLLSLIAIALSLYIVIVYAYQVTPSLTWIGMFFCKFEKN